MNVFTNGNLIVPNTVFNDSNSTGSSASHSASVAHHMSNAAHSEEATLSKLFLNQFNEMGDLLIELGDLDILETLFSSAQYLGDQQLHSLLMRTMKMINSLQERKELSHNLPLQVISCIVEHISSDFPYMASLHAQVVALIERKVTFILAQSHSESDGSTSEITHPESYSMTPHSPDDSAGASSSNFQFQCSVSSDDTVTSTANHEHPITDFPGLIKCLLQVCQSCPGDAAIYFNLLHQILHETNDIAVLSDMILILDMQLKYSQSLRQSLTQHIEECYSEKEQFDQQSAKVALSHSVNILIQLAINHNQMDKREGIKTIGKISLRIWQQCLEKNDESSADSHVETIFQLVCDRGFMLSELILELSTFWCSSSLIEYRNPRFRKVLSFLGERIMLHLFTSLPESRRRILSTLFRVMHQHPNREHKLLHLHILEQIAQSNVSGNLIDCVPVLTEGLSNLVEFPPDIAKGALRVLVPFSLVIPQLKQFFMIHLKKQLMARDPLLRDVALFGLCQYFKVYTQVECPQREAYECELIQTLKPLFASHLEARCALYKCLSSNVTHLTPQASEDLITLLRPMLHELFEPAPPPLDRVNYVQHYSLSLTRVCTRSKYATTIEPVPELLELLVQVYPTLHNAEMASQVTNFFLDLTHQLLNAKWLLPALLHQSMSDVYTQAILPLYEFTCQLLSIDHPLATLLEKRIEMVAERIFHVYVALSLKTTTQQTAAEVGIQHDCMISIETALKLLHQSQVALQQETLKIANIPSGSITETSSGPNKISWHILELSHLLRVLQYHAIEGGFHTLDQQQGIVDCIAKLYLQCTRVSSRTAFGWRPSLMRVLTTKRFFEDVQCVYFNSPQWGQSRIKALCLQFVYFMLKLNPNLRMDNLCTDDPPEAEESSTEVNSEGRNIRPAMLFSCITSHLNEELVHHRKESALDIEAYLKLMKEFASQDRDYLVSSPLGSQVSRSISEMVVAKCLGTASKKKLLQLMLSYSPYSVREAYISFVIEHMQMFCSKSTKKNHASLFTHHQEFNGVLRKVIQFVSENPDGVTGEHLRSLVELSRTEALNDQALVGKMERAFLGLLSLLTRKLRKLRKECMRCAASKEDMIPESLSTSPELALKNYLNVAVVAQDFIQNKFEDRDFFVATSLSNLVDEYHNYVARIAVLRNLINDFNLFDDSVVATLEAVERLVKFDVKRLIHNKKRKRKEVNKPEGAKRKKKVRQLRSTHDYIDKHLPETDYQDTYEDLRNFIA